MRLIIRLAAHLAKLQSWYDERMAEVETSALDELLAEKRVRAADATLTSRDVEVRQNEYGIDIRETCARVVTTRRKNAGVNNADITLYPRCPAPEGQWCQFAYDNINQTLPTGGFAYTNFRNVEPFVDQSDLVSPPPPARGTRANEYSNVHTKTFGRANSAFRTPGMDEVGTCPGGSGIDVASG